jgi:hypothetical protein
MASGWTTDKGGNRVPDPNYTGSWEQIAKILADYADSLAGTGGDLETLRAAMRQARRDYPRLAARVDGKFPADPAVKVNTTLHHSRPVASDGRRIWDSAGEVLAERPAPMSRREAGDKLSAYAIAELKLDPSLVVNGTDAGMREAMRRARRALPDAAGAWH